MLGGKGERQANTGSIPLIALENFSWLGLHLCCMTMEVFFANNLINELMGRKQRLLRGCTNE